MNLILLGAPGAGKGSAAIPLSAQLGIPHISSGDIFRENIRNKTELGILAETYISKGSLVPDDVTIRLIEDRLKRDDCANGFILDGYPRTIKQALALDYFLKANGRKIDRVINIVVSEKELLRRLTARRVCPSCKATFSTICDVSEGNPCPLCGTPLIRRDDDTEEVILQRFRTYHEETEPLVEYYKKSRKLSKVRSESTKEDTYENILVALRLKGFDF